MAKRIIKQFKRSSTEQCTAEKLKELHPRAKELGVKLSIQGTRAKTWRITSAGTDYVRYAGFDRDVERILDAVEAGTPFEDIDLYRAPIPMPAKTLKRITPLATPRPRGENPVLHASGSNSGGGSALIKALADETGLPPSKVRALLRKSGLSRPYTNEVACRKALGV